MLKNLLVKMVLIADQYQNFKKVPFSTESGTFLYKQSIKKPSKIMDGLVLFRFQKL